jgi:hypothetical protein
MLGLVGVIARDTSVAGFTVRVVDPDMLPDVAVMVLVPAATEVARPFEPVVLLIDATLVLEEFQATVSVRSCVVLSEKVPVAVNCCVVPLAMLGLVGVIARDASVAGFTVSVVDPDMPSDDALIVVVPAATAAAKPELLIVATPVLDEPQVTDVVRFCVVLSENVPVAVNCWVVPLAMLGLAGVIARATSDAPVTVRSVEPEVSPDVAVIVVLPAFFPYAYACLPVFDGAAVESGATLVIVATLVSDELQVTDAVRSCVVLSE